jgi:O-acetyl-ADP-ribose deacetylase (regulator of RNase III)
VNRSNIIYCEGDATRPIGDGQKLIVHVCNNRGGWGAGFTGALSRRWTTPEAEYRVWARSKMPSFSLNNIQLVGVAPDITVVNMIAQEGYGREDGGMVIVYEALRYCLEQVAWQALEHDRSVHMPRIGCGLAGGHWSRVEPIIAETLKEVRVFVYDLKTRPRRETQYKP